MKLNRINNVRLLQSNFINDIGLLNGKMGAIYFFHSACESENDIYQSYAEKQILEIYEETSIDTHFGLEKVVVGNC